MISLIADAAGNGQPHLATVLEGVARLSQPKLFLKASIQGEVIIAVVLIRSAGRCGDGVSSPHKAHVVNVVISQLAFIGTGVQGGDFQIVKIHSVTGGAVRVAR